VAGDEEIFPVVLEGILRQRGKAVDVMNFGVSGYNTQQEVETLRDKGLVYRPDLVVLSYCLNDDYLADDGLYGQLLELERQEPHLNISRLSPWLARSALFRFVNHRVLRTHREKPAIDGSIFDDTVSQYFDELGRIAAAEGFEVLVVVFPGFDGFGPEGPYRYQEKQEMVASYSMRNGFHHLDLLPAFRRCMAASPRPRLALDRYHPSAAGHRCAARAIAERILSEVWVDGAVAGLDRS
jgi:lysophospholipase L1-like esterase